MKIHPCPFQFSRMGSNHDRLNQNQKCYHYTTGNYRQIYAIILRRKKMYALAVIGTFAFEHSEKLLP
jgi:hypothetical protein